MMAVMTAQPALPFALNPDAIRVGLAMSFVETEEGGQVFIRGDLCYFWDATDIASRRLAAIKLVAMKAAKATDIAAAFGVTTATLWNWAKLFDDDGVLALVAEKRGPKKPSKLSEQIITQIHQLHAQGLNNLRIAELVEISEFSVRRALKLEKPAGSLAATQIPAAMSSAEAQQFNDPDVVAVQPELPILPEPIDRTSERAQASMGPGERSVVPVFAPAARVPHAGLFFALPALETTGLLPCAIEVFGALPRGFYGLETIVLEAVLRTLAGEPRVQGATRLDPAGFGRILGLDRAPEVKTIRRKHHYLADTGKSSELMSVIGAHHLKNVLGTEEDLAAILYVDGHIRAYQGKKKIGKHHSTRLKFPVPATEETWVSDSHGAPVLMVMAEPAASLVSELRRLLPSLRDMVGDDRRVLVGFDRGGWSPELFEHMRTQGFDTLTWRKGSNIPEVPENLFTQVDHVDEHGQTHAWEKVADTQVELVVAGTGELVKLRQISRIVPLTKGTGTRQIHILTTLDSMSAGEIIYRMSARWRQENYFRFAREHFALDSHDAYGSADDDPQRMVPNPAKTHAKHRLNVVQQACEKLKASTDAALLEISTPKPGSNIIITNQMHTEIHRDLYAALEDLEEAQKTYANLPARVRLGDLAPGQQVLDTEMKLFTHVIRMAAYNASMALAREIRINTGYKRANREAHALIRKVLRQTGDIDPTTPGILTIRLDPMPTTRETKAIAELCEHLTETKTVYPGTDLILKFAIKTGTSI